MNITIEPINKNIDRNEYFALLKLLTIIDPNCINQELFEKHLELILSNPLHKIFIAKEFNKIIGTITILIEPKFIRNCSLVAHIEDVVVDSEYRSNGVGKTLVQMAIDYSKEKGCYKIILDCNDSNVEFYKKCGFDLRDKHMAKYL